MSRRFMDILYGSTSAEFESAFDLAESIRRLTSATSRSIFTVRESAVGTVSESYVSLQRVIPLVGNSYKPLFVGAFCVRNGRTFLAGSFAIRKSVRVFMSVWFGFMLLWTVLTVPALLQHDANAWWFPFAGIGMLLTGVAFVWFCKWLARNDVAWLSNVILNALSSGQKPPNRSLNTDTQQQVAASRPLLRAGYLQRYTALPSAPMGFA
jgi:hypothetical protein